MSLYIIVAENDHDGIKTSYPMLADAFGLSYTQVRNLCRTLVAHGFLHTTVGGGRGNETIISTRNPSENPSTNPSPEGRVSETRHGSDGFVDANPSENPSLNPSLNPSVTPSDSPVNVNDEEKEKKVPPVVPPAPPEPTKPRKKPHVALPESFTLTDERRTWAMTEGLTSPQVEIAFKRFSLHAASVDRRQADWDASWRNWVLSDIQKGVFQGARPTTRHPPEPTGPREADGGQGGFTERRAAGGSLRAQLAAQTKEQSS